MPILKIILELLKAVLIAVFDAIGLVPITQTVYIFILVVVSFRVRKQRWPAIGSSRPNNFGRSRKNLTIPIVSHGVSNTLAFILMYFGVYPGMGY